MSDTVTITKQELQCLRRHYQEGLKMLQGLGVREQEQTIAPELSESEKRIKRYTEMLNAPKRRKKQ